MKVKVVLVDYVTPFIEVKLLERRSQDPLEKSAVEYAWKTQKILGLPVDKTAVVIKGVATSHWVKGGVTFAKLTQP